MLKVLNTFPFRSWEGKSLIKRILFPSAQPVSNPYTESCIGSCLCLKGIRHGVSRKGSIKRSKLTEKLFRKNLQTMSTNLKRPKLKAI